MPLYRAWWPPRPVTLSIGAKSPGAAAAAYLADQDLPPDLATRHPVCLVETGFSTICRMLEHTPDKEAPPATWVVAQEGAWGRVRSLAGTMPHDLGSEALLRCSVDADAREHCVELVDPFGQRRRYSRHWDVWFSQDFDGLVAGSRLDAWCDGSGVPGDASVGSGAVVRSADGTVMVERSWSCGKGTNNIAELQGVSLALATCSRLDLPVTVRADSKYAIGCVSNPSWRPTKNRNLIAEAQALAAGRLVRFEHVRGHSGDPDNERADALAGMARQRR